MPNNSAAELLALLQGRGYYLAIAESLTGGLLAAEFVAVPGASKVLLGSITAYQNSIKQNLLGVPENLLESYGAVSAEVAEVMATGAREQFARAAGIPLDRVVGISTTGNAGPDADGDKPVGKVFIGISIPGRDWITLEVDFDGGRQKIRTEAVNFAISELRDEIGK